MLGLGRVFLISFLVMGATSALAVAPTFMYQGRIVGSDGQALEYSAVSFEFTVTSPDGSCVLYRELKNGVDMRNSKGVFDTPIGSGTKTFPLVSTFSLLDAFSNGGPLNCDGGATYTPSTPDGRKLRVQFFDGVGWRLISPDQTIRSVPYAGFSGVAESATRLGSKTENDFILKNALPLAPCAGGDVLSFNGTGFVCVTSQLADGSVTGSKLETVAGLTAGAYGSSTNIPSITVDAKGRITSISTNAVAALPLATTASGKFLKSDGVGWAGQNILFSDIKNSLGASAFNVSSCSSNQTIAWSSLTDSLTCQNVTGLDASAITSGVIDAARLPSSVTSVATGVGLTGGPITSSGTISIANGGVGTTQLADGAVTAVKLETITGLTAGSYGGANAIPSITIDNKGRITAVTTSSVSTDVLVENVKNASGVSVFSTSECAANQTLSWSLISDTYVCKSIGSLNASTITAGTLDAARLPSSVTDSLWSVSGADVSRNAGSVGIGTSSPASSSILDVSSTAKGFLPPRLTTAQRNGIASPAAGLIVFDSTENKLYVYNGTRWAVASDSESGIFRAYRSLSQSIVNNGVLVPIITTAESIDPDNAFDVSTGTYTVPLSGFYHFSSSANLDIITKYAGLRIQTDTGIMIANTFLQMSAGAQLYLNASGSAYLNAGEKVRFYVWQWETGNVNLMSAVMSGFRVGSGGNSGGGVADHLGNHVATQNLVMGSNWISGDGTNKGIRIESSGNVGIGTSSPTAKLEIGGTAGVDGIRFPDGTLQTTAATAASNQGLGVGQAWVSVAGSRACGTTYTNSTGRPIQVIVSIPAGAGGGISATVGGVSFVIMSGYGAATNMTGSVIVPNATTYAIACSSFSQWVELR